MFEKLKKQTNNNFVSSLTAFTVNYSVPVT